MGAGDPAPGPGEAVLPELLMRKAGLDIGDSITILDRPFTVVGLSDGTFSLVNSVTFIAYGDMETVLAAPDAASYILVEPTPGTDAASLAAQLQEEVPGITAMTRAGLADNDRDLTRQMGVDIIRVMSFIGFVVGVLVVGLTTYTATVRRSREYGVVKALGATRGRLLYLVAVQTLALTMFSFALALAVAYALVPLLSLVVPEVPLRYPVASLATWAGLMVVVAFLSALLPAYRIGRVEPAVVFKE
jgi:putative ABC transport system permease protein